MKRLIITLLLLAPSAVIAQPMMRPPAAPIALPVPTITQRTLVWCWLAVAEMVIRYRNQGRGLEQCQMMSIGHGMPPQACCADARPCARPGQLDEIQRLIAHFGGRFNQLSPPQDPMSVYQHLRRGTPIIASINSGMGMGHVVVIRGMRFVPQRTRMGVQWMPMLLINDPMSMIPGEVPYRQFLRQWRASILVY